MSAGVGAVCQDVAMLLLGCIAGGFYDGNMFFMILDLICMALYVILCISMRFFFHLPQYM